MDGQLSKIGIGAEQKPAMLHLIDRIDKLPADIWDEKVLAEGLNAEQLKAIRELLENRELWHDYAQMRALFSMLEVLGVADYIAYDPKIIRGLDYYTGTVFEAHAVNGEFRAILGGGHYANLVGEVGGSPLPGVGFAMGDVVIMLVLEAYGLIPADLVDPETLFVTVFNEGTLTESIRLAGQLRAAGFKVIQAEPEKLAKQFKYADRLGLSRALVIGPEEIDKNCVVVKDLHNYEQVSIDRGRLIDHLRLKP
jgi:histidyl-tRNA synthetase